MATVFERLDQTKINILGFSPIAVFTNVKTWRKYIAFLTIACAGCWALFGFDSTWSMLQPYIENFIPLITGEASLQSVYAESQKYYGTGNHFSAPVIYGAAFIILSLHLERQGIKRSLNFFASTALSLMSIGIFEWIYNPLYAVFQNQPWVVTFAWKQVTNLYNFTMFIFVGALTILYLRSVGFRLNLNKKTLLLFALATLFWATWVAYPFPVQQITVQTTSGAWTSSTMFPQTMYAVDVTPDDGLARGVPFHVENNLLHLVNLLAKVFTTAFILSLCMVKPHTNNKYYDNKIYMRGH